MVIMLACHLLVQCITTMEPKLWFVVFLYVIMIVSADFSLQIRNEVRLINSMQSSWKADSSFADQFDAKNFKRRLGLKLLSIKKLLKLRANFLKLFRRTRTEKSSPKVPKNYDIREAWPNCAVISSIKDQSTCGSCWAVATASMVSDRRCIASNGTTDENLSSEDLLRCCDKCKDDEDGCQGGDLIEALLYVYKNGIVSGGDYGSNEGCMPYSFAPCYNTSVNIPACLNVENAQTEKCNLQCSNKKYSQTYEKDKFRTHTPYLMKNKKNAIENEMIANGSLLATMDVYKDFLFYESGIYHHVIGEYMGAHVVRLIGWGTENGTDYWLAANSWGTNWGNNGTVKVKRNKNGCNFAKYVLGTAILRPASAVKF